MRVYVNEPKQLDLTNVEQYELTKLVFKRLYSSTGVFDVYSNNIYSCKDCFNHNTEEIIYDLNDRPVQLLLDYSIYVSEKIESQLPVKYIVQDIIRYEYAFNKKSPCKLVVEKSSGGVQHYFEIPNGGSLEDLFVQTDLDKLLSMCFYS